MTILIVVRGDEKVTIETEFPDCYNFYMENGWTVEGEEPTLAPEPKITRGKAKAAPIETEA